MARTDRHAGGQRLARLVGWLSAGLGTVQLTVPEAISRLVGVEGHPAARGAMRAVGAQELVLGAGILARPGRAGLLWTRVAGDAVHLGLLARAVRDPGTDPRRLRATAAAVGGMMVVDLLAARRVGAARHRAGGRLHATASVTVNRGPGETYRFWRDLENLPRFMHHLEEVHTIDRNRSHWVAHAPGGRVEWDAEIVTEVPDRLLAWRSREGADVPNSGTVRFQPAPRGAGTEVNVDLDYQIPGGRVAALAATMLGEEPTQQIRDDLRRFKQVAETGEVVRSDGTPEGTLAGRQLRQRPAQPVG